MLNTISGASTLPRELLQWLDSLDLSYAVRNPRIDLSNGFIIAEILARRYPSELSILTFYNAQRKDRKIDNWQQIQKRKHTSINLRVAFIIFCKLYFSACPQKVQNFQGIVRIYNQSRS